MRPRKAVFFYYFLSASVKGGGSSSPCLLLKPPARAAVLREVTSEDEVEKQGLSRLPQATAERNSLLPTAIKKKGRKEVISPRKKLSVEAESAA